LGHYFKKYMNTLIIFGAEYLYLVIVVLAIAYIWRAPKELQKRMIVCAIITLPVTYIVAKIASQFYYNARPFIVGDFIPLLPHTNDNGFPSDHTLLSSAIAMTLFFFYQKRGLFLFVVAFLVGLARVLVGIHHLSDIFGSMIIASLVAYIIFTFVLPKIEQKFLIK